MLVWKVLYWVFFLTLKHLFTGAGDWTEGFISGKHPASMPSVNFFQSNTQEADPLTLELQIVVRYYVGAGNQADLLEEQQELLSTELSCQPIYIFIYEI